jgi:hypothetical protein
MIRILRRFPQDALMYRRDSRFPPVPMKGAAEKIGPTASPLTQEIWPPGVEIG